jgi:hypothetical protein
LGQFACAGPADSAGQTVFSDPCLTAWVQKWVNGSQANYGIILKMHDDGTPGGDSFSSREDTWSYGHAPQLQINHEPLTSTITGKIDIDGYNGDMSFVGVQVELKQNGSTVRTERLLADATGNFSFSEVSLGTYDIAVKVCTQLPKTISGVEIKTGSTNLGTINLIGSDLDGNARINFIDLKLFADNWLVSSSN